MMYYFGCNRPFQNHAYATRFQFCPFLNNVALEWRVYAENSLCEDYNHEMQLNILRFSSVH